MPTNTSRPGGKESLLAAIAALPERRTTDRPGTVKASTDFLPGAYGIVVEAAKGRRMSLAAYLRRAAYAMACHDLDLPLSDALSRDPRVTRESGFAVDDEEGVKFGPWERGSLKGVEDAIDRTVAESD
jgi:hypothetical protein